MITRWKAAGIHFSISLVLAFVIATLLYFLWFPSPYFIAGGANTLIVVLMGVDLGIGPLLTLIVVSPLKSPRLLKFDLLIIATMQSVAFAYGIHVIAMARPIFVVAEIDRLVLVAAGDISDEDLSKGSEPIFRARSWTGPVLVGALPPKGAEGIQIAEETMRGGKDIDRLPQFYVPYDQVIAKVMRHAKPLSQLKNASVAKEKVLKQLNLKDSGSAVALPLQRGEKSFTAIMSSRTSRPMTILSINPW
jgi:hypothetical protein